MAVLYASFIARFPEFGNVAAFPQVQVEAWLGDADAWISNRRFSPSQIDLAKMLWTAHNLALGRADQKSAATGATPGEALGPVANKSVDKVSVGYGDGANEEGAGVWNSTSYGRRLYRMMRAVGTFAYVAGPSRLYRRR